MPNLFIIGNGFDIAHGLHTNYSDFRQYLINEYNVSVDKRSSITYELYKTDNNISKLNDNIIANFIIQSIDFHSIDWRYGNVKNYLWSQFEEDLAFLPQQVMSDYLYWQDLVQGKRKNKKYDEVFHINESYFTNIRLSISKLKDFFGAWIKEIDELSIDVNSKFQNIINPLDDLFFTFNYTHTLERLYGCKNICHIHGDTNGTINVGHGNPEDTYSYEYQNCIGVGRDMVRLANSMRKETEYAVNQADWFFNLLEKVEDVYSVGFSYSNVDLIYIQKICEILYSSNAYWNIESYPKRKAIVQYQQKIKECGFKGRFGKFSI